MSEEVSHSFGPFIFPEAKILILGTFPSPKSREQGFYYGHPQNRFWKAVSAVLQECEPLTLTDKESMLVRNKIALWDVIERCEITGASDSSIKNPVPTDIAEAINGTDIKKIFTTGKTATKLLKNLQGIEGEYLPSPSPANCACGLEELITCYKVILEYIK